MKNQLTFIIGIAIVVALIAQFTMYQLPYNEVAVVATFNKADENDVIRQPGLKFRFPPPIQQVRRYTTNLQMHEPAEEELQTKDKHNLIVSTYVAWKIHDPYKFYIKLDSVTEAENQIAALLKKRNVIGEFDLKDIVNIDPRQQKIPAIEDMMAAELTKELEKNDYGITIHRVGIRSIELPGSVTQKVFERMINERRALAERTRSEGQAIARTIKDEAQSKRERIMAFANRYAEGLRTQGRNEARETLKVFQENPEFANFLLRIKALPLMMGGEDGVVTIFMPAEWLDPQYLLQELHPPAVPVAPGVPGVPAIPAAAPAPAGGANAGGTTTVDAAAVLDAAATDRADTPATGRDTPDSAN